MISLEYAILATYLMADMQLNDDDTNQILSVDLKEELFLDQYNKLIVKTINYLSQLSKPIYLEYIVETMQIQGIYSESVFNIISTTNQLSPGMFSKYYKSFCSSSKKTLHGDI